VGYHKKAFSGVDTAKLRNAVAPSLVPRKPGDRVNLTGATRSTWPTQIAGWGDDFVATLIAA
jgi:hypothetical protein